MNFELLASVKSTNKIINITNAVQSATYTTNRTGTPGTFKFNYIESGNKKIGVGDVVRFSVNGKLIFYGWIFTISANRFSEIEVTCYDRLRYLKANASYAFYSETVGSIITQIAEDFTLDISTLENTGYKIPSMIKEDKSCLDIISEAIEQTLLNTGKIYVFFDDGKGLSLKESAQMKSNIIIGENSLLTDYTYQDDIDKETYNSVKLVQPNKKSGRADVYQVDDSETIKKWGLLRLYKKVDENLNFAQITEQAKTMLKYYNRASHTLTIESLGVLGLRAGMLIPVYINNIKLADKKYILLEKVTHKFENETHTMTLEAKEI